MKLGLRIATLRLAETARVGMPVWIEVAMPDKALLAILQQDLYHPDTLVRRFAMNGPTHWPKVEAAKALERLMQDKGPSDVIGEFLSGDVEMPGGRADGPVQRSRPYLRPHSPVLLRGAIVMVSRLALHDRTRINAPVLTRTQEHRAA